MSEPAQTFLDPEDATAYDAARAVVLPVPYERTTSWGQGTRQGPAAILEASQYLETWDQELGSEPARNGIHTLPSLALADLEIDRALDLIRREAERHLAAGKLLAVLGGEHGLTPAVVAATREIHADLGVVQFDAHADLRDEYGGTPASHACAMRRLVEVGIPTLGVGIRSLSAPEAALIRDQGLPTVWGEELPWLTPAKFGKLLDALPDRLYLTFDIDFFDPSEAPGTGTPEPGGGRWQTTLPLLRELFRRRRVVAIDVVEVAPIPGQPATEFLAAKLLYKCFGYGLARAT